MHYNKAITPANIKRYTRNVVKAIRKHFPGVQGVAFTGVSGAAVGWTTACKLGLAPVVVRKVNEPNHEGVVVCGTLTPNLVIVDDFVESGKTMNYVVGSLDKVNVLGVVLYQGTWDKEARRLWGRVAGMRVVGLREDGREVA
jgi:adenine/guanine phosphoribosyltransferase-like PRPP-binding protein